MARAALWPRSCRSGFEVVVLEQGPRLEDKDFKHDELKIRNTPALVNDHALQPNTFRKTTQEKAQLAPAISYGRCVGGGTVHYTGSQWRFHEIDFMNGAAGGRSKGQGSLIGRSLTRNSNLTT